MYTFPCGPLRKGSVIVGDFTGVAAVLRTFWGSLPRKHFTHWEHIHLHQEYPWYKKRSGITERRAWQSRW